MHTAGISAYDLRTDGRVHPLTVDSGHPQLSWRLDADGAPATPTGIVIQAASSAEQLESSPDLWESGLLPFTAPRIAWGGEPLLSGQTVFWRVGVAADGEAPSFSAVAQFGMALLEPVDWEAQWVTHPEWVASVADGMPALERRFAVDADIAHARLYAAGAGVMSVEVNGERVTENLLAPGYSRIASRIGAVAWDLSTYLRPGQENLLRIELGTGISWVPRVAERYTKLETADVLPRVLARLDLRASDGRTSAITTDSTWTAVLTATVLAHWFSGEDYDARVADHSIAPAHVLGAADLHPVWWSRHPGLGITEVLPTQSITQLADGSQLFDFGVNIAGWEHFEFEGLPEGTVLTLWPGEILDADGHVDQATTGSPLYDTYIAREGAQAWHPHLVYHGFRYIEVRGLPAGVPHPRAEALVIRATNEPAGSLTTSDPYLATLDRLIDRAIQGNMFSVFTDCPNREKLGWVEQLHLCFDALVRHYDVAAHLRDALVHIRDSQLPSGNVPSIAPETVDFSGHEWRGDPTAFRDDPHWGAVIALLPWRLFETYGDRVALIENWDHMVRYADYLESRAVDGMLVHGLGDWIELDTSTPRELVATFGYLRLLDTLSDIADELQKSDAATHYRALAASVRVAFATRFGNDDGSWGSGSQGSYAIALDSGSVPDAEVASVQSRLLESIASYGGRVSAGEIAWPSMLRVLHGMGRDDVVSALIRDESGPGYGWQIAHGATALPETWLGATGSTAENSQNHFMLGMVHDWITGSIAGLTQHTTSRGWSRAHVRPTLLPGLTHIATDFESPLGRYAVEWSIEPELRLTVTVPPGGSATIDVPLVADAEPRSLDGLAATPTADSIRFEAGAGRWEFAQ